MTTLQDKTPEELTLLLAKILGWTAKLLDDGFWHAIRPDGRDVYTQWVSEDNVWSAGLPPYATSYDAIMGEILRLDVPMKRRFSSKLRLIAVEVGFDPIFASPTDLTRALILTKQTNEETK